MKTPKITEYQANIYRCWLRNNQQIKPTAKELGKQPEKIKQAVAAVKHKLSKGLEMPE